jgi:hypothetical protein
MNRCSSEQRTTRGAGKFVLYGWSIVENPLALAGTEASFLQSPWTPLAWYGSSVTAAVGIPVAYYGAEGWAMANPTTLWRMGQFAQGALTSGMVNTVPAVFGRVAKVGWGVIVGH